MIKFGIESFRGHTVNVIRIGRMAVAGVCSCDHMDTYRISKENLTWNSHGCRSKLLQRPRTFGCRFGYFDSAVVELSYEFAPGRSKHSTGPFLKTVNIRVSFRLTQRPGVWKVVSTPLNDRDFYAEHRFFLILNSIQLVLDDVSASLNVLEKDTVNQ